MRIIQVATLVTPDGAYGGPTRVAVNQVRVLREAGHDAVLAAAYMGYDGAPPKVFDGVPVKLFPARKIVPRTGFAGLASPALNRWLGAQMPTTDVMHIHLARDFVTLPAAKVARRKHVPYVVQTHGMIDPSSNLLAKPLDRWWTIPTLRSASAVFYLTALERTGLEAVAGKKIVLAPLANGVPSVMSLSPTQFEHEPLTVLFLARLHPIKRPEMFARAALELAPKFPEVRFIIAGPDEGARAAIEKMLNSRQAVPVKARITLIGPIPPEKTRQYMTRCALYVLPSVTEQFPMSVLEALSVGKPVIVTDSCGLAPYVRSANAGIVIGSGQEELDAAIANLLGSKTKRAQMSAAALNLVNDKFSMETVRQKLLSRYSDAVEQNRRGLS